MKMPVFIELSPEILKYIPLKSVKLPFLTFFAAEKRDAILSIIGEIIKQIKT